MIVDTSALVAILRDEPEATAFVRALADAPVRRLSVANWLEAAIVVDQARNPVASRMFDELVRAAGLLLEPVDARQVEIARAAYRDFGRGSGHPARLNFGDCFAYALAKVCGEPLLFKGNDFSHTDVEPALP